MVEQGFKPQELDPSLQTPDHFCLFLIYKQHQEFNFSIFKNLKKKIPFKNKRIDEDRSVELVGCLGKVFASNLGSYSYCWLLLITEDRLSWWQRIHQQCRSHSRQGLIPESGRSPGGGLGNPLQYSCLENPMDREAWWATVYRVTELAMTKAT